MKTICGVDFLDDSKIRSFCKDYHVRETCTNTAFRAWEICASTMSPKEKMCVYDKVYDAHLLILATDYGFRPL